MVTRRTCTRAVAIAAATLLVVAGATACRKAPTVLTATVAVSNLDRPWDVAFLPDGTMLLTERVGRVRSWDGATLTTIAAPADVAVQGEGGMLGLTVDPDFTTNRFIYTCFNTTAVDVKVVRWALDPTGTALTDRTNIVTGIPTTTGGRHSGCRPRFGPDGMLWVTTGDAARGPNPQSPTSLAGKVLRIDRDGAPAADNPGMVDPLSPLDDRIYTYGHRNVQGIAFRPSDGAAFSVEHGTSCDDEVNRLVAGANYGWDPEVPGNPTAYDESGPMTDLVAHPDALVATWSSGCPTIAPSGATFLSGPQWKGWNNSMAIAVLKDRQVRVFWLDPAKGNAVGAEWTALLDEARFRSAVQGPDGNLYLVTDTAGPAGRILRVVPSTPT